MPRILLCLCLLSWYPLRFHAIVLTPEIFSFFPASSRQLLYAPSLSTGVLWVLLGSPVPLSKGANLRGMTQRIALCHFLHLWTSTNVDIFCVVPPVISHINHTHGSVCICTTFLVKLLSVFTLSDTHRPFVWVSVRLYPAWYYTIKICSSLLYVTK